MSGLRTRAGKSLQSTVLVVDDDPDNIALLSAVLRPCCQIRVATNGLKALAIIESDDPPDLVLLDVMMPGMSGLDVCRKIQSNPARRHIPVIFVSALGEPDDECRGLAVGAVDYLRKPLNPSVARARVRLHVDLKLARVAVHAPQESDLLSDIGGLDVASGLRRVLGSEALYLSLLKRFIEGQRHVEQDVALALDVGDRETAGRLAHTLRGVSGNIGATIVQQSAGRLETAIKQRRPRGELNARLDELKSELATLILRLELSLPQERAAATREAVNTQRLDVVCEQLTVLLARDDAEAVEVVLANEELLRAALPCHFRALEHAVHSFAFDAALTVLREARGSDARGSRAGAA